MIKESLEGKIRAPVFVFADKIEFGGCGMGGVMLSNIKTGKKVEERFTSFSYESIQGIYDSEGRTKWENSDFRLHIKVKVPENLRGTQVVFTDQVVYEGANMGGHHLSFFDEGRYKGHDHEKGLAFDFPYSSVKIIFDRDGRPVWENRDYVKEGELK